MTTTAGQLYAFLGSVPDDAEVRIQPAASTITEPIRSVVPIEAGETVAAVVLSAGFGGQ